MAELQHIAGLKELSAALKELPKNIGRNVLRGAVSSGAVLIRNEARQNFDAGPDTPHAITGELRRDIQMKRERASTDQRVIYSVFVRTGKKSRLSGKARNVAKDSFYWRFVEFGHWVNTTGAALKGGRASREINRSKAISSGHATFVAARPFMRPAFQTKKSDAMETIRQFLITRIPQEVAKLPKR